MEMTAVNLVSLSLSLVGGHLRASERAERNSEGASASGGGHIRSDMSFASVIL